jgi:hypothetical protein
VAALSLCGLAAALGTSHRMPSYHFGSREGLLIESSARSRPPAAGACRAIAPTSEQV